MTNNTIQWGRRFGKSTFNKEMAKAALDRGGVVLLVNREGRFIQRMVNGVLMQEPYEPGMISSWVLTGEENGNDK